MDEGNTLSRNLFIFAQKNNKEISHYTECASLLRHFASVKTSNWSNLNKSLCTIYFVKSRN